MSNKSDVHKFVSCIKHGSLDRAYDTISTAIPNARNFGKWVVRFIASGTVSSRRPCKVDSKIDL